MLFIPKVQFLLFYIVFSCDGIHCKGMGGSLFEMTDSMSSAVGWTITGIVLGSLVGGCIVCVALMALYECCCLMCTRHVGKVVPVDNNEDETEQQSDDIANAESSQQQRDNTTVVNIGQHQHEMIAMEEINKQRNGNIATVDID